MKAVVLAIVLALTAGGATAADNPALATLFQQDQADREGASIDWQAVTTRDAARRAQAKALLDQGAVRSAADYYHAAMVFQHGETLDDYRLANALAPSRWHRHRTMRITAGWPARAGTDC
jgi:hypothetical protein